MSTTTKMFERSLILLSENKLTAGKKELEKLIVYDNNNYNVLNLLSLCEYKYCNFRAAKSYIDKSLQIKESKLSLKYKKDIYKVFKDGLYGDYMLIINNLKKGELKSQIDKLEEIKFINPQFIEPYILLSMIYLEQNKFLKARKNIKMAYEMDTSNEIINNIYLDLKL